MSNNSSALLNDVKARLPGIGHGFDCDEVAVSGFRAEHVGRRRYRREPEHLEWSAGAGLAGSDEHVVDLIREGRSAADAGGGLGRRDGAFRAGVFAPAMAGGK